MSVVVLGLPLLIGEFYGRTWSQISIVVLLVVGLTVFAVHRQFVASRNRKKEQD
jgi:hypothetical protein